jgi:hypothetical protein
MQINFLSVITEATKPRVSSIATKFTSIPKSKHPKTGLCAESLGLWGLAASVTSVASENRYCDGYCWTCTWKQSPVIP